MGNKKEKKKKKEVMLHAVGTYHKSAMQTRESMHSHSHPTRIHHTHGEKRGEAIMIKIVSIETKKESSKSASQGHRSMIPYLTSYFTPPFPPIQNWA